MGAWKGPTIKRRDKVASGRSHQLGATSKLWSELAIFLLGPAQDRVSLREDQISSEVH